MTPAEKKARYERLAEQCIWAAADAELPEIKARLLRMAATWQRLAARVEEGVIDRAALQPGKRARRNRPPKRNVKQRHKPKRRKRSGA